MRAALRLLSFAATLAACLGGCPLDSPGAPIDFVTGIGTHNASGAGLDMIAGAGISSLREDIRWDQVEREKGVLVMPERYERYVTEALRRGLSPLLILCYGNPSYDGGDFPVSEEALEGYARFAEFVVSHFRGRVQIFEIWNEWNYGIGLPAGIRPGEAGRYAALLAKVYPRLKAANPRATILGGAMSGNGVSKGWFETACQAGLLDHLDALSYHPYCWHGAGLERTPEGGLRRLIGENLKVAQRYRRDLPVYLTEIGWPTYRGDRETSLDESARFLARTFLMARTFPSIKGVWWYDFQDDGQDPKEPEHHFGLVFNNLTPKPAYFAMRDICRLFREGHFAATLPTEPGVEALEFRRDSGERVFALWESDELARRELVFESTAEQAPPPARVTIMGGAQSLRPWTSSGKRWQLPVRPSSMPCVVETGLIEVKISAAAGPP